MVLKLHYGGTGQVREQILKPRHRFFLISLVLQSSFKFFKCLSKNSFVSKMRLKKKQLVVDEASVGGSVLLPHPLLHSNKCQILLEANITKWNERRTSAKKLFSYPFLQTTRYNVNAKTLNAKSDFVMLLTDQADYVKRSSVVSCLCHQCGLRDQNTVEELPLQ